MRDLVRARGDLLDDRKRAQQRLNAVLLRHGRVWRGGSKWTYAHRAWVDRRSSPSRRWLRRWRCTAAPWRRARRSWPPWTGFPRLGAPGSARRPVARLGGYRGIAELTGLTLAAGVIDWRRFASAPGVHGVHRADPQRVLQRVPDPPRRITKAGPPGSAPRSWSRHG